MNKLDNLTQKLYEGYIQSHFRWMHYERIRSKFRVALLDYFTLMGFKENIKIIDINRSLITHLSYRNYSPNMTYLKREKYGINGEFHQITSLPYKCINRLINVKLDRSKLKNPLQIIGD